MTYDNFIQLIKEPEGISEENQSALKELIDKYPYFGMAHWLYLKSLYVSDSIYFDQELKKTVLYASDRRKLYFFIYPEESVVNESLIKNRTSISGSYFDMLNLLDNSGNGKGSLQTLAEKLKKSRQMLSVNLVEPHTDPYPIGQEVEIESDHNIVSSQNQNSNTDELEKKVKLLIRDKKYEESIEILEKLNLINPKKSVYFADQIRFLKKIIKT